MTTIICATDASASSARVVATAATMSRVYDAELELFHTVAIPPTYPPDVTDEQMVAELRDAAEAAVSAQAAVVRAGGLRVRTRVQLGGPDAIVDRAREADAALLVLGTHARHGAARLLLGSVAERTLRAAPCPTLVVPPSATGGLAAQHQAGAPEGRRGDRLLASQRRGAVLAGRAARAASSATFA